MSASSLGGFPGNLETIVATPLNYTLSSGGSRKQERGDANIECEARTFWVTPTSGAVKLGEIPFSAKGSPILDLRKLTAANSHYLKYLKEHSLGS